MLAALRQVKRRRAPRRREPADARGSRIFSFSRSIFDLDQIRDGKLRNNASHSKGADDADRNHHRGYFYFSRLYRIWLGIGLGGPPNERVSQNLKPVILGRRRA